MTFVLFGFSQNPNRQYYSHVQLSNALEVQTNDGTYFIKPYSQYILETSFVPKGERLDNDSHAVVLRPSTIRVSVKETKNTIEYKTAGISAVIQKSPFKISYSFEGKELTSEKRGYVADSLKTIELDLTDEEVLFGGGARALGMNRRGHRLQLYNRAHYGYEERSELMNFTMPIVISSNKYLLHFDNAPIGFLDLDSKKNNTLRYETISGRMTYQIVAGETWLDIIDQYTDLTGKQPMIPRWALGNFSSRFGYHSQAETVSTVEKFIREDIPVDAVILDLFWFGKDIKGHMGGFEFAKDSFPNPKKMISDFMQKGIKTVLISEPFILSTSKKWDEAVSRKVLATNSMGEPYRFDFYFGNAGIIDIYDPNASEWFWDIYKDLTETYGVSGWWGDLGEPEAHPSDLQHYKGTADEVHNIYGHDWAKLIFHGYRRDLPEQRPFILMRAGYSGSQHYGMIPWSGDVSRSWGGFQPQPEISLQMGMQGMGYMHSDLGGFAGDYFDDELYLRWLQYGVFQPIYRPHAQESVPSEAVYKAPKTKELAKQAIELRYSLLPYNYTLAYENHTKGYPLMRPLFFEEESDSIYNIANTYLWGNDILVSPIMKKGEKKHKVYFPNTSNWIDFYTGEIYAGGTTLEFDTREDRIPTFVRGGAFVPRVRPVQNTASYSTKELELHFYYDDAIDFSKGLFYNDDGKTTDAIDKGEYEYIKISADTEDKLMYIDVENTRGPNFQGIDREMKLVIHGLKEQPRRAKVNNSAARSIWNNVQRTYTIPFQLKKEDKIELFIKER